MTQTDRRSFLKTAGSIGAVGTASFAGCLGFGGGGGGGGSKTLRIGVTFSGDHPQVQLLERWSSNLEERTDGALSLTKVTLGGEEDHLSAASSGSIAGHGTSMTALTQSYGAEYGFIGAPFVAEDYGHFLGLLEEYVFGDGGLNSKLIEEANQRILDGAFRGLRGTTSNFPVREPADIEGVNMRLPEFETWVRTWQEIGASATPVPYDELYQALQTGVVSASEGPIAQFVNASLYEVQTHFSQTDHLLQTQNWVLNEGTWQGLSDSQQKAMQESLDEAISFANELTRSNADDLLTMVQEEHDVTVVPSEDIDKEAFRNKGRPQLKRFFEDRWKSSLEEVRAVESISRDEMS